MVADSVLSLKRSKMKIGCQAADPFGISMIAVKTELVANPKQNDHGAGHPNRQTGNAEDGMNPMPADISNCCFEVVQYHEYIGFAG